MGNQQKTKAHLESEVAELRRQVDALEAVLAARHEAENDQLNRSLLATQPHPLYRIDQHSRLTFANPVILQRWGLSLEQVLGHPIYEFLPDELVPVSRADDQAILSSGEPQRRVYEYFDAALGQAQLIQSVKFPLRDAAHNVIGLQGVFWDVTLHEEAQRALQKRNAELSVLNRSLQALTSTLNLNEVLTLVLNELRQILTVSASSIWLLEPDSGQLVCREATGPHSDLVRGWHLPQDSGFVGWVIQHKQSLIIADAHTDERHFTSIDHGTGLAMRSIISVPLCSEQQIIGVIQAVDVNPNRFSADDLRLIELLATAAAIAIANARLFEKTWQRAEQLAMLNELSTALNQPTDLMALLQTTTENLTRVLKADQMGLALMDDARDYLTVVADVSAPGSRSALGWKIPVVGNLSMQHVLETKVPLVIQDVPHSPLLANIQTMMLDRRIESMLLVPLVLHGEVIGTYGCDALDTPRHFTPEDIELAVTVANMIATRIEQARLLAAERDRHVLMENHAKELEQRITERTRDLSEANEQLKDLDRMKDQFISRISHELRTPLANIKLYANLLEHGLSEKRGYYLQTLNHEVDRLDRLIEDLLDVSYLSSTTTPIDLLPIDLR